MRLTRKTFGSLRRPALAGLVLGVVVVFGAASGAFAQAAPTPAPAPQPPAKPDLALTHDAGIIYFFVKPDKTADFEDLMNKLKEALAKSEAPEAKQQIAGMKLFKNPNPSATMVTYVMVVDPVVKEIEYWFLSILYKAYPNDAQAIYQKWQDIKVAPGQQIVNLALVAKFQ
jgi:hypothetical protein